MLLFIEWYPSVPLSLKQNKHKSQKTKKHKTATITTSTNRASTKNFITMTSFWQTYKLQPLICSLVTRTNARVLFFPLWRQEWLMTTQEVWFNHRKSSFPYHSCLQELLGLSGGTSHCYSSDTVLLIVITKRWVAVSIPGNTIFS